MICLPSVLIQQKLQLNPHQSHLSFMRLRNTNNFRPFLHELSAITSEPTDNGDRPSTAGPTLDVWDIEEEQLMSVLATSGLTCQAYGDCRLPSPSIPSTSHCVTVDCTCSIQSVSASDPQQVIAWDTTERAISAEKAGHGSTTQPSKA